MENENICLIGLKNKWQKPAPMIQSILSGSYMEDFKKALRKDLAMLPSIEDLIDGKTGELPDVEDKAWYEI